MHEQEEKKFLPRMWLVSLLPVYWFDVCQFTGGFPLKLSTLIGGQDRISPYNVSTISGRQLMGIMKNIN